MRARAVAAPLVRDTVLVADPPAARPAAPPTVATWRALGTYVHLQVSLGQEDAVEEARAHARAVLDLVDATCSRFRDDSDLTRANRRTGRPTRVSPVLAGAVRVALEAADETAGIVSPLLGEVLVGAGYDRPFRLVPGSSPTPVSLPPGYDPTAWRRLLVEGDVVQVPTGSALDLGATGKAYAADLVAESVAATIGVDVLVSVGGDVATGRASDLRGDRRGGRARATASDPAVAWTVEVGETLAELASGRRRSLLRLAGGGVATSSVRSRRWTRAGRPVHHLLDPRTGRPASGPWRTVTATGRTCVAANTASTAAVVLGDAAPAWLAEHGVAALLLDRDGRATTTPGWPGARQGPRPEETPAP